MGKTTGYAFRYFSKDKYFTKKHIVEELSKIPEAKLYIPDDINAVSISRDYLFAVSWIHLLIFIWVQILATVNPEKYVELYNNYKKKLSDKSTNKWSSYQVHMNPEIAEKLKNFSSCGE